MKVISKEAILIKDLQDVYSPTFNRKRADDILSLYKSEDPAAIDAFLKLTKN